MDRSICYFHAAGLPRQKKVNVVGFTVRCLHVHAREIFPVTKVLQAIIVYPYQVESEILSFMFDMKLAVAAFFGFGLDVLFYSRGDISRLTCFSVPPFLACSAPLVGCSGCSCEKSTGAGVKNSAIAVATIILMII